MAGGKSEATESHNVYQSEVAEQYQWFTEGLLSLASNLLPPVPGIMITGLNPFIFWNATTKINKEKNEKWKWK